MTVVIILIVIAAVLFGVLAFVRINRRRPMDGVESFRRHIDALSPAARREVIDRVQNARDTGKGK